MEFFSRPQADTEVIHLSLTYTYLKEGLNYYGDGVCRPTGGLAAQVGWPGLRVGSRLALPCTHQMNRVNSRNYLCHDDSTINIVPCIIIIIIIIAYLSDLLHRCNNSAKEFHLYCS